MKTVESPLRIEKRAEAPPPTKSGGGVPAEARVNEASKSTSNPGSTQAEAARVLISSLADAGLRELIVAPGSRSTPLLLAALKEPRLAITEIIDERSAAFFALGQTRVTGRPSALLTTSGTAGAHAYPAILEAEASNLPLLVITADRPLELQHCGALQTIDQRDLFGRHVNAAFEVSLADRRALERIAAQAMAAGRAHLNVKASKPLETEHEGEPQRSPMRIAKATPAAPPQPILDELSTYANDHERGVIIAGPLPIATAAKLRDEIYALSERTGWPLLAEATSNLRFTKTRPRTACDIFEPLLRAKKLDQTTFVLQLGAMPTSSAYDAWIRRTTPERVILTEHGVPDATSTATLIIQADLLATIQKIRCSRNPDGAWASELREAETKTRQHIAPELHQGEAAITHAVITSAKDGALLMVGNGLPIRHLDLYTGGELARIDVLSQRGASGIDGLISGTAGSASVAGGRPVLALIGDVSALHDLTGLAAAKQIKTPLAIIVIHNDGGRIFEQLPIGAHAESDRFTTPHGTSFAPAAALFGIPFFSVENAEQLRAIIRTAQERPGPTLIEARVDPHDARDAYARVWRNTT